MGKRSSFDRLPRDFYPTPAAAVQPLLQHLAPATRFIEPCAGDGALINHLADAGHICTYASDIDPADHIDAAVHGYDSLHPRQCHDATHIITNPPWDRKLLHPMIAHFTSLRPTWLLFDADWVHTRQAAPYMPLLRKIVSVGRVKWIADSPHTGKDNCAWHLFDIEGEGCQFYGR